MDDGDGRGDSPLDGRDYGVGFPPTGAPSAPVQAYDAKNADKVDGHHAASSSATNAKRANRVLWAQSNGKLSTKALPMAQLNNRYLKR